ncbi:unnamed protein product [Dovyalis caffra]|uniref:DUF7745 domain-containing protein n=1 Tax=Dovyalis caffra TaxID=77055 RepID=A0AAV1SLN2_9ROSI|nr:unnamed protein product [Dovyalis caffra]
MIDFEAINVFKSVVSLKINPTPVILAKNTLIFEFLLKERGWTFKVLVSHYYLFGRVSHIVTGKASGIFSTPWHLHSKLENFARHSLNELGKTSMDMNVLRLREVKISLEGTICFFFGFTWLHCGEYPWVSLIGAWCCITYCPNMFSRQLGFERFISRTMDLAQCYKDLKVSKKLLKKTKAAWRNKGIVTLERRVDERTTSGYPKWQSTRGKGYRMPPFEGPSQMRSETMEGVRQEMNAQHEIFNEVPNARVIEPTQKKRKLEETLGPKDHAMSALNKQNKDLHDRLQRSKGLVRHIKKDHQSLNEKYENATKLTVSLIEELTNLHDEKVGAEMERDVPRREVGERGSRTMNTTCKPRMPRIMPYTCDIP